MADLRTTQERRDRFRAWLHDEARDHLSIRAWCVAEDACHDVDTLLAENARLRAEVERLRGEVASLALLTNPQAARDAAQEARENRAVAEQRVLLRWFLDGDDHTHEDDCGARGSHDLDVCRNTKPCADETCEGPHCTCDATEMRDRARAALGEP